MDAPHDRMGLTDRAAAADAADGLAPWRQRFYLPDPDVAYLDGNSLGMPPTATLERVQAVMADEWGRDLITSWNHWVDMPRRVGDLLAPVIGATPGEVIVHDSTTVNLYQLVRAAMQLSPQRPIIAIAPNDFPTDRYIVDSVAAAAGWRVQHGFDDLDAVGVVVRSMIDYRTAEVVDLVAEQRRADAAGAIVIWDLSHAAGLHPIGLHEAGATMAVGCTYKFLNGGPGAPGFTYVAADLIDRIEQPLTGWFGQLDQFAMGETYQPRPDIGRMLIGTPSILALAAAEVGIDLTATAGIDAIYAKSQQLGRFAIDACDELGLATSAPRDDRRRGGHIGVHHPEARAIVDAMVGAKVIADFREPDVIRLGMSPLTTRFADVARALLTIDRLAARRAAAVRTARAARPPDRRDP